LFLFCVCSQNNRDNFFKVLFLLGKTYWIMGIRRPLSSSAIETEEVSPEANCLRIFFIVSILTLSSLVLSRIFLYSMAVRNSEVCPATAEGNRVQQVSCRDMIGKSEVVIRYQLRDLVTAGDLTLKELC
jgi:hypothetical protein